MLTTRARMLQVKKTATTQKSIMARPISFFWLLIMKKVKSIKYVCLMLQEPINRQLSKKSQKNLRSQQIIGDLQYFWDLKYWICQPYKTFKLTAGLVSILDYLLAQKACVRHACLPAQCIAWPLLSPTFALSFSLSPSFAFDPLRGNSQVRNNFSPNILA